MSPITFADSLFAQLDGRIAEFGSVSWRIEVFSVWVEHSTWLQIGLRGPSNMLLTLRLPLNVAVVDVIAEIDKWFRAPAETNRLCNAVSVANTSMLTQLST